MNTILWKMQLPVSSVIRGPEFLDLGKRECEIRFSVEGEDGTEKWLALCFTGIEVWKCTYLTSLGSVNQKLRQEAYGALIRVESSSWLSDVNRSYREHFAKMPDKVKELQHLMFCFDDGPCYEFICAEFKGVRSLKRE
jgi:hypothetical protein